LLSIRANWRLSCSSSLSTTACLIRPDLFTSNRFPRETSATEPGSYRLPPTSSICFSRSAGSS
jgi:hypothetical protein